MDNEHDTEIFTGRDRESTHQVESRIENIFLAQQFIQEISTATLDNGPLDEEVVSVLRNPREGPFEIPEPDVRLPLDVFIGCKNASEATYNAVRDAVLRRFPGTNFLSHHLAKKVIAEYTGVVSVLDNMCINSCQAFTGPLADRLTCSECGQPRYMNTGPGNRLKP